MALFRLILFALGAAVCVCAALYVFTGRSRYLTWAWRLLASAVVGGLAFFAILLLERLS